ncbi:MAG: hypothetical protein WCJ09_16495 [Planctomycetota bacterium]
MRNIFGGIAIIGLLAATLRASGGPMPLQIEHQHTAIDQTHRLIWEHTEGLCRYVDKGEDYWVELDKSGKVFLQFKEVRRNVDFVELFDERRGYTLRLYKNAMLIRGGNDGFQKFADFTSYDEGRWVK